MSTVVILGGGISGLSAAKYLSNAAKRFKKIIVLEATPRLGGWLQSVQQTDGSICELGPRSIRPAGESGYNTLQLVEELGLRQEIISITSSHPASKNRLISINGSLMPIPSSNAIFRKVPPFKKIGAAYLWHEWRTAKSSLEDESIQSFFTRRLGKDIAEYVIDPLCIGIYAGKASELSIRSCFPVVYKYEQESGSILKGLIQSKKSGQIAKDFPSSLINQARSEKWAMWSLKRGLEQLVVRLTEFLQKTPNVEIHTKSPCTSVSFENKEIKIKVNDKIYAANHLISSLYSEDFSGLLHPLHSKLAKYLSSIPAVSVAVVHLEYKGDVHPCQAFGYLVPSCEKSKILGVTFDSCVFPEHSSNDEVVSKFTVMLGGAWFEEVFGNVEQVNDAMLVDVAISAVKKDLQIEQLPFRTTVAVHKNCLPQYKVGHHQILKRIDDYLDETKLPLTLIGSSYMGASLNDCIYNAKKSVQKLIKTD